MKIARKDLEEILLLLHWKCVCPFCSKEYDSADGHFCPKSFAAHEFLRQAGESMSRHMDELAIQYLLDKSIP